MTETAVESVDFRHKFGPWPVGFPYMISRYHHPGPIHVSIRHADQMRPETDADGRWRKQAEADGSRKMAETALDPVDFRHEFGPGPVGFPDMLPRYRHPGPQTCFHQTHGPDATGNGCRRKMAEANGI